MWTQKRSKRGHKNKKDGGHKRNAHDGDIEMEDVQATQELEEEEDYWKAAEADDISEGEDEPEDLQEQAKTRFEALAQIVR